MTVIRLGTLCLVVLGFASQSGAQSEVPPAAQEILKQMETESAEIDRQIETELTKWRAKAAQTLKEIQDATCRKGLLDEAVAVRNLAQQIRDGAVSLPTRELPLEIRKSIRPLEDEFLTILRKAEDTLLQREERARGELRKVQEAFSKEAKLDEALAVRDLVRNLHQGPVYKALPDPGYVNAGADQIGKVVYYEVVGNTGGSIYGTDVYTTGSHLGTVALHCGLLKPNERGVLKVTILPGQAEYPASTRNGITSSSYGTWSVSFKAERGYISLLRSSLLPRLRESNPGQ